MRRTCPSPLRAPRRCSGSLAGAGLRRVAPLRKMAPPERGKEAGSGPRGTHDGELVISLGFGRVIFPVLGFGLEPGQRVDGRRRHGRHGQVDPLDPRDTIDPYTGKQFIYRTTGGGFTLYSAGIDRDDDGGAHHDRFGERGKNDSTGPLPPDGDHVFWPIPDPSPDDG